MDVNKITEFFFKEIFEMLNYCQASKKAKRFNDGTRRILSNCFNA